MGSKKFNFFIARALRHTPRKAYFHIIIYQSLNIISSYLYTLSLEGGDVDYLVSQVGFFGGLIFSSMILNILVMALNFYTCSGWVRVFNIILQVAIYVYTLTQDLGTDLMNHGQYNILFLVILTIPMILIFLLYIACRFTKMIIKSWLW